MSFIRGFIWLPEHTDFLLKNSHLTNSALAQSIGCCYGQINLKKHQLGLCKPPKNRRSYFIPYKGQRGWTSLDDDFLRENYLLMTNSELASHFCCSLSTLYVRRSFLFLNKQKQNHTPYSKNEIAFILDNFDLMTLADLGSLLGRSYDSLSLKCLSLGLKKPRGKVSYKKYKEFKHA